MEQTEKKLKALRLVAMIFGLVGGGALILSIFTDAYSVNTALGNITVSMTSYMSGLVGFVFLLAGCSIAFSLLKLPVPQIITGSVATLLALFMCWHIKSKGDAGAIRLNISFGAGAFLFLLGAGLILAAGIIYAVAANQAKAAGIQDENDAKRKKIGKTICICLGALAVLCLGIGILSIGLKARAKKQVKETVQNFMKAAISYDVDSMNNYLAKDVKDKNGLMEAYTPDVMSEAFLSTLGANYDDLGEDGKKIMTETSVYFGKSYLKKCTVEDVTINNDGSYTVKVPATIIDMNNTDSQIVEETSNMIADYGESHATEIYSLYLNYSTEEATAKLMDMVMPSICSILNNAISNSGEKETEFTIVVDKVGDDYKIIEIDYED